jgi:hypothetical protein
MVTGKRIKNERFHKNDYQMKMKVHKCHIVCEGVHIHNFIQMAVT